MTVTPTMTPMPGLPRLGEKVCWRNPEDARACGWEAIFGPGPYAVVRTVDHSNHGLAAGVVLRTAVGEAEIPEVWLAVTDQAQTDGGADKTMPVTAAGSSGIFT